MTAIREEAGALVVDILVSPRASKPRIGPLHGDRVKVAVTAPPVDGAANDAVVDLVSRALGRPRRDVEVVAGHASRRKTIRVRGASRAQLEAVLVTTLALIGLLATACTGAVGTIAVGVVAAPGSDLVAQIDRARVTLTNPGKVIDAERDGDGELSLSLDIEAASAVGFIEIEGFDASGDLIAFGRSGPLPFNAVDAAIQIYVAAPRSIAAAPVALDPPRTDIGAAVVPFGAVLAGGRDADGEALTDLVVYNVYDHELQVGMDMPDARARPTAISGDSSIVYLFGGEDSEGDPASTGFAFNTAIAPAGIYTMLDADGNYPRAGAPAAQLGPELIAISGIPVLAIDGTTRDIRALAGAPQIDGPLIELPELPPGTVLAAGAGVADTGAVLLAVDSFTELTPPAEVLRTGHAAVVLADGDALLIGGELAGVATASVVRFDAADRSFEVIENLLDTPRAGAAIAASFELVVVAGGTLGGGDPLATVELFDATTLEPLGVVEMERARTGAVAVPLANGQVLVAGGTDETGAPVATIELVTPARE